MEWELPDEIASLIVSFLRHCGKALSSLQLVNKQFYAVIRPIICANVSRMRFQTVQVGNEKCCKISTAIHSDLPGTFATVFLMHSAELKNAMNVLECIWNGAENLRNLEVFVDGSEPIFIKKFVESLKSIRSDVESLHVVLDVANGWKHLKEVCLTSVSLLEKLPNLRELKLESTRLDIPLHYGAFIYAVKSLENLR